MGRLTWVDPELITPILLAISALIGLPLALWSRKKGGPKKIEELYLHLQTIGLKATVLEKDNGGPKIGKNIVGTIKLAGKNVDSISVIGVATQNGVQYYLDYQVNNPVAGHSGNMKVRMIRKKSPALWGKVVDIGWKGDDSLVHRLDMDYQLKDRLKCSDFKGSITVSPEPKSGYIRIRTSYFLPDREFFDTIDTIARHIKCQ